MGKVDVKVWALTPVPENHNDDQEFVQFLVKTRDNIIKFQVTVDI